MSDLHQHQPKYMTDNPVYSFYFDWKTGKLKYKKLLVAGYDYTDVPRNIIDEYKLVEEYTSTKYFFFKKKGFTIYKIKSHLISDNIQHAKLKLLYYFLKEFDDKEISSISDKILKMILTAKTYYNNMIKDHPDLIMKAIGDKISDIDDDIYWR